MKTDTLLVGIFLAMLSHATAQPVITGQPQNQTNVAGTTATLSVIATGTPPLSYQWVLNSLANRLPGATNDTLVLPNVQASNAGNYRVVVTNDTGSVLSATARLTVVFPPVITNQPVSLAGIRGNPVIFRVGADGTPLLAYQWYFNDTGLADQTNASLTVPSVSDLNAGNYAVTVINSYGTATSRVARLTIDLSAQVVVVPNALATNDGNSRQTSPTGNSSVREMTIYDAAQFGVLSGPSFLTQFAYRPDTIPGPSGPRSLTLRIYASTTTQSVAGLSTTFAENLGTNNTLVFNGTVTLATGNLPGPGNTRQFDIVFPFTTPFLYDPAAGNLLLDLQFEGSGSSAISVDKVTGNQTVSKVLNNSSSTATTGGRDVPQVIQFTFRAILSVRLTETNTVLISWPAPSTGFELQQNAALGTDNWTAVGSVPATVGSERQVIVPSPAGTRFYRLRKP